MRAINYCHKQYGRREIIKSLTKAIIEEVSKVCNRKLTNVTPFKPLLILFGF